MCGFPLRFAQEALGHNSKAVHHAYASKAEVKVPSLDMWEKQMHEKIVEMKFDGDSAANQPGDKKAGDDPAAPLVVARP